METEATTLGGLRTQKCANIFICRLPVFHRIRIQAYCFKFNIQAYIKKQKKKKKKKKKMKKKKKKNNNNNR